MTAICFNCFRNKENNGPCPYCGYNPDENRDAFPLALRPGTVLAGRYTLGRVLGQGGFGVTYIALDHSTQSRVVVKEYLPADLCQRVPNSTALQPFTAKTKEYFDYGRAQFLDEAKTLANLLGNEHIVRILTYFEENGTAYFSMEYLEGVDLKHCLNQLGRTLRVGEANRLLLPVMESLDWVHSKGIIHRDISPDNIMILRDGNAKLIDFGSARYSTGEVSKSLDVVLKHGFAPKEQYTRRGRQGPFTDVYAIAATYYYAITGKVPPDAIYRSDLDELVPPSQLGVDIRKKTEAVMLKALAVSAQDRYQTMREFHDALLRSMPDPLMASGSPAGRTAQIPAMSVPASTQPGSSKQAGNAAVEQTVTKKGSKGLIAAIIALAVLAAVVFVFLRKPNPTPSAPVMTLSPVTESLAIPDSSPDSSPESPAEPSIQPGSNDLPAYDPDIPHDLWSKASEGDAEAIRDIGVLYETGDGLDQDYGRATEWYQKAAELGNVSAMCNIGRLYNYGLGVTRDYGKALEWYRKAADLGDAEAMLDIGLLYASGNGVQADYGKAIEWYRKAADLGNAMAMDNIGLLYRAGLGVTRDYDKALEWFRKAADVGEAWAMFNIGELYDEGQGVTQDYGKAMEWYRKAAELDNASAMRGIGILYEYGKGVTRDYGKAMEWYRKAAELGDELAMCNIGELYDHGRGVAQDRNQAQEWFRKAEDEGDAGTMLRIGSLYGLGDGITQDYGKAMEWYRKAAELGNEHAMSNVAMFYRYGTGVARDYGKAMEWFQKAADLGDLLAMSSIGSMYENGEGVTKDYGKAMEWYRKAADLGNSDAMIKIGSLFENGLGVSKDYSKAREWYQKAADAGHPSAQEHLDNLGSK